MSKIKKQGGVRKDLWFGTDYLIRRSCMKKLRIAVLIVLTMMLSVTSIVYAEEESISNDEKIEYLKSIGTTEEALANLNPKQIDEIYDSLSNQKAVFSGCKSEIVEIADEGWICVYMGQQCIL